MLVAIAAPDEAEAATALPTELSGAASVEANKVATTTEVENVLIFRSADPR